MKVPNHRDLPACEVNPFTDPWAIAETYLFETDYRFVESELQLLVGLDVVPDEPGMAQVGAFVFRGISEFSWITEGWRYPEPPSWWTVLESGFTTVADGPRVIDPPIPGADGSQSSMIDSTNRERFRYRLYLSPNATILVQFESASFVIGAQNLDGANGNLRPNFANMIEWEAACQWPE